MTQYPALGRFFSEARRFNMAKFGYPFAFQVWSFALAVIQFPQATEKNQAITLW